MKSSRKLAFIDERAYQNADNRCKTLINILCLFLPISALVGGFAFAYSINFLLASKIAAGVVFFMVTYGLFNHDRTLLEEFSMNKIIFRIALSIVFALLISVPYKTELSRDNLIERIHQKTDEKNAWIMEQMEADKQEVYDKEADIMFRIEEAAAVYQKTGKMQLLIEARRAKDAFLEQKPDMLAAIEAKYEPQFVTPNTSNVALASMYFHTMFDSNKPEQLFTNLFIFVLLIFVEAAPAGLRLALEGGSYMRKKQHWKSISNTIDEKLWGIEEQLALEPNLQNLPTLLVEHQTRSVLRDEAKNGFKDVDSLISLVQKANTLQKPPQKTQQRNTRKNGQPVNKNEFPDFTYTS